MGEGENSILQPKKWNLKEGESKVYHNGCGQLLVHIIQFYSNLGNLVWEDFLAVLQISITPHTTWNFNQAKTEQEGASDKPKGIGAGYSYSKYLIPVSQAPANHTFQANVISIFLFCNFVKYMDWQSSRRGMDQIWLEVGQESRIFLESCFVLATYRNSFAKYGYFWTFFSPHKYGKFCVFFPQKLFLHFALDSCFCCHSTKFHPKKKTLNVIK